MKNIGNVLLLGAPGAGKGTQAQYLTDNYSLKRIDTGTLIRSAIAAGTELGIKAKEFVSQGKLVPDGLVVNLILGEIKEANENGQNFLLDGFPRNVNQAKALEEALISSNLKLDYVLEIDVEHSKLLERITGRRLCTNKSCNAVYHLVFSPPKNEGVCDLCGSALYQRDDDKAELVQARLNTYLNETLPLVEFYTQRKVLQKVDGNGNTKEVTERVKKVLAS